MEKTLTQEEKALAAEARRNYARRYRQANRARVKETTERYWLNRALREQEQSAKEQEAADGADEYD